MPYYRCPGCDLTVHSAAAFSAERICPDCSAALPAAARIFPTPTETREIRRVLPARPEAVGEARRALQALPVTTDARGRLELVVSELVSNSVLHAGLGAEDPISVYITGNSERVRIAVRDGGSGFDERAFAEEVTAAGDGAGSLAPGGRGCLIVDALAGTWGVERGVQSGCTVWAEVEIDEHPREAAGRTVTNGHVRAAATSSSGV